MCMAWHALHAASFAILISGVRVGDDADSNATLQVYVDGDADLVLKSKSERDADAELLRRSEAEREGEEWLHYDYPDWAEHSHDHAEVKSVPFACHSGLNNWEAEWSDQKKKYCCETEHLGCKAEHFDCLEGIDRWQAEWSELKMTWCCHNKNIACVKCDDYSCPPGHKKIAQAVAGSLKCAHSPCKNSECCELWGNMELVRRPTPAPTAEPATPFPTPMPTIKHDDEPFDCSNAIVDANTGWSQRKKEWCCINKNIGCKDDAETDENEGRHGIGTDGRRRVGYSDGRRRWSSKHDHFFDEEFHDYYYYYHLFPDDDLLQLGEDGSPSSKL